tara:strand:+ start:82 stop:456 length:375 start_codon:yes stop_codon:yes gene_type:complete
LLPEITSAILSLPLKIPIEIESNCFNLIFFMLPIAILSLPYYFQAKILLTIDAKYCKLDSTYVLIFMTLGGANVRTDFSCGYHNESSSAWLSSPNLSRLILFTRNKKYPRNSIRIFTHSYYEMI